MPSARFTSARSLFILALLSSSCTGTTTPPPMHPEDTAAAAAPPRRPSVHIDVAKDWKEVDRLVDEQKLEEASKLVKSILEKTRAANDEDQWAKALMKEVTLREALGGYETAVRNLKAEAWPEGPVPHLVLELYYAYTLTNYINQYSWEINKREKIDTKGAVDLKAWTKDQIFAEALRAYQSVWSRRAELGTTPVDAVAEFITPNTFPKEVRGTLRDAISYLAVAMLADTAHWRPEQTNERYQLDFKALLTGNAAAAATLKLDDSTVHPVVKLLAVLDDLEAWHQSAHRTEAALETRLERARRLSGNFTDTEEQTAVRKDVAAHLDGIKSQPWWSMGMATLAELVRDETQDLVEARRIALEGAAAFPTSVGGARCKHIAATIESPDYSVQSMTSDGVAKRSIEVNHKNLEALYFRAYPVDLLSRIEAATDYNLLPAYNEFHTIVHGRKAAAEWSVTLPATPDYRSHRTFVTPPLQTPGLYVIAVSARKDFSDSKNRVVAVNLIVGDLVLEARTDDVTSVTVTALSGATGKPIAGAELQLWQYDWRSHHQKVETRKSDAAGEVKFAGRGRDKSYLVVGLNGHDVALDGDHIYFGSTSSPTERTASLVYTDRSIYRPEQTLHWKVISYHGKVDKYQVATGAALEVVLRDANHQEVARKKVKTNSYGSAAGDFLIPAGRLLGHWQIQVEGYSGYAAVRVEEYKRPTFEVSFKEAEKAMRLNQPAEMTGEARYYFGLPVTNGTVKWRITREPVYPWWYWMWYGSPDTTSQTVATGVAALDDKGLFHVKFTPAADERQGKTKGISFSYHVAADLTDEGGETRSASRNFRLGFVSVEARIDAGAAFHVEGQKLEVEIARTNLDGAPRAGKGTWKLVALTQPRDVVLPADEPVQRAGDDASDSATPHATHTPGDAQRPRWDAGYRPQAQIATWKDGAETAHGDATHDDKGQAKLTLPSLAPGAYRLRYETTDDFGAKFETWSDILVAAGVGKRTPLALPALLLVERSSVKVGDKARVLALSSLPDQLLFLDIFRDGLLRERRRITPASGNLIEIPITDADRGGFAVRISTLRDHQHIATSESVFVPWDDKELQLEFATFRDLLRPGARETWRVTLKAPTASAQGSKVETSAAELLAYMYDRSLDVFAPHSPPSPLGIYPSRTGNGWMRASLGSSSAQWITSDAWFELPDYPQLAGDALKFEDGYGIGGMGYRSGMGLGSLGTIGRGGGGPGGPPMPPPSPMAAAAPSRSRAEEGAPKAKKEANAQGSPEPQAASDKAPPAGGKGKGDAAPGGEAPLRTNFSETAFWQPNLITDGKGQAAIEFTVPDSVTSWNVWVHTVSKDLRAGSLHKETRTVKDLLVRPYLPRFFREGDQAELKVVVNNASKHEMKGTLDFDVIDPETKKSLLASFGLKDGKKDFTVPAGGGTNLSFPVTAPRRIGTVAFLVKATAGDTSDGELRPLPILPSRVHLMQSRFVTLHDADKRTMTFPDLAKTDDPTRDNEQMVVTVDAQLFYTVLKALPYLIDYPYECTEQSMNRFLSTGILTSLFTQFPAVARMAEQMSKRETRLETFDASDPNRKMALEEAPWLEEAKGGADTGLPLIKVLDPRVARANRDGSLAKLEKAQTASGGWPWFPGGPPSPYITLYLEYGFAKAAEFKVDVPKEAIAKGWHYLADHFRSDYLQRMREDKADWEWLTFLNYVAGAYPDGSWTTGGLSDDERKEILAYSFKHWKEHSPYLKGLLSLTLHRLGRHDDAVLVFSSVMDSAKTLPDQGTFWQPEDRSWLWYNDTIESHAFALRVLMELMPDDKRQDGLVLWLLLNKKLNHWKSTKATAEVIYSLAKYMKKEGSLGIREEATVTVGPEKKTFVFEPDQYVGKSQLILAGDQVGPKTASVTVEKPSKGVMFASATWHFSTEQLPKEDSGDFFQVSRTYFKRENTGKEFVLKPLVDGAVLQPGDEVEVQMSLRSKHAAEYVHLRDPRAAGLEPDAAVSQWKWDLGISWYQEIRDSGTNFFFEQLPAGEYTFKYRVRANVAGKFRVGPATVQSLYAPEFAAYTAGNIITVAPASGK